MDPDQLRMLDCLATGDVLARGDLTATELTQCYLDAIDGLNPTLNCYLHVDHGGALAAAGAADERRRQGSVRGSLDGIPVALKDNIAVTGWPNTAGFAWRAGMIAATDAAVTTRLKDAGAVLLGSLNMDEGALGATTINAHFGACQNPNRIGYTAGGSSGGAACAVRGGLTVVAIGSDTMGSVRIPASYCGVVGFKPSFDAVAIDGVVPLYPRLDHLGFLTRRVKDLRPLLSALAGASRPAGEGPIKVGVVRLTGHVELEPAVETAFDAALVRLEAAGAQVTEVDLGGYDAGAARRAGFLLTERALADWLGTRRTQPGALSAKIQSLVDYGARQSDAQLAAAEQQFEHAVGQIGAWRQQCDVLATPTTPQRAFPLGDSPPTTQAHFTVIASLVGWPAISIPAAHSADSLPVGLHLVAPSGEDLNLVRFAEALELDSDMKLPSALARL